VKPIVAALEGNVKPIVVAKPEGEQRRFLRVKRLLSILCIFEIFNVFSLARYVGFFVFLFLLLMSSRLWVRETLLGSLIHTGKLAKLGGLDYIADIILA
jgi:hypothetical protein